MKKALGQTVRDLKREVNKKVLKVPGIEQKVLDATSNEPWGPHGSLLADIAHASKNFNDYQMIMTVIWKRINDIGKNWRHVYKGLTVLEYLVAHGSERVIDEIKEHSYQISTLSDFQYIDSGGRDQGSNVRKKSQSLVVLVNDKERIIEVRQKAAANRDKFRNASSTGGMYRPGSGGYGDRYDEDRYGNREDDKNGYGREREWGNKDDDRYGKIGDNSSRDGDRYGRDSEERYGRDSNRDGDYQGRSRSVDDYNYGSRSRSADRDRDHAYDDDANSSSRGSGARADENSQEPRSPSRTDYLNDLNTFDNRHIDRKFSEQNLSAPPSYEEAVNDARSPVHSERGGESPAVPAPKPASPPASTSPSQAPTNHGTLAPATTQGFDTSAPATNQGVETFDEFDPRGSFSAAPTSSNSNGAEMDFLGSLSDSFNALAIVPTTPEIASSEANVFTNSGPGRTYSAPPSVIQQAFDDPFGDSPFKASPVLEGGGPAQTQGFPSSSLHPTSTPTQIPQKNQPFAPKVDETSNFSFGDTFPGISYTPTTNVPNQDIDILADILPPSGSLGQLSQPTPNTVPNTSYYSPEAPNVQFPQHNSGFHSQAGFTGPAGVNGASFIQQPGTSTAAPVASQMPYQTVNPMVSNNFGSYLPQSGPAAPVTSMGQQLAIVPQPSNDKFQTKSTVWADTLNRGLVNLNISGSKTNPLADIGIDFDAINRKEKRMEKPSATPVTSNINMGKAMGSGTGIGRAGAGAIRPSPNPMMPRPGMGMGMAPGVGMGPGAGMGMVGYGGMNQPMGMGMGMNQSMGMGMNQSMGLGMNQSMGLGMNQPMGMGMNMNVNQPMGMGMNQQGAQMQQQPGMPQTMQGGYNPMMGTGGYAPQQYHQGYR